MSDLTGYERASLEARESEQRSTETLLRVLTVPFDLDRVAAWVEDPAVNHSPLARGVMRASVADSRRLRKEQHDLINEQHRRVGRMHAEAALLRKVVEAARAMLNPGFALDNVAWMNARYALAEALRQLDESRPA